MHIVCYYMHMRTTVILKDELVEAAKKATGVKEKTALIHLGLQALIQRAAFRRLIEAGGKDPRAKAGRRRR
ncbi:MAG: type II toxin-antitoxin system VapB family antitoxin [Bacteriovoracia bacterium]